jgi:hypothetical protein
MCTTNKEMFLTKTEAEKVRVKMETKYHNAYHVYKCEKCLTFHIAHTLHKVRIAQLVAMRYVSPQ